VLSAGGEGVLAVGADDVHIVAAPATAVEAAIEGEALASGCEWALNAARKLLRNGRWVGMVGRWVGDGSKFQAWASEDLLAVFPVTGISQIDAPALP